MRDEHHEDHDRHRRRERIPEMADTPVELGLGRPEHQSLGDLAELGCSAGCDSQTARSTTADVCSEEHAVRPLAQLGVRVESAWCFQNWKTLTGEDCFAD